MKLEHLKEIRGLPLSKFTTVIQSRFSKEKPEYENEIECVIPFLDQTE